MIKDRLHLSFPAGLGIFCLIAQSTVAETSVPTISPKVVATDVITARRAPDAPPVLPPQGRLHSFISECTLSSAQEQHSCTAAQKSIPTVGSVLTASEGQEIDSDDPMAQVTSVSQLRDVQPTDWAFQALQSLVERYGCISGYPDRTYRGNRSLTRYEFAAGLNACLQRVNELIAAATSDLVRKEDLATIERLQKEFAPEIATVRGRVDTLEARTAQLEANQFSTTTKLLGQAIIAPNAGGFSGRRMIAPTGAVITNRQPSATFLYRADIDLNTSFNGTDLLKLRLDSLPDLGRDNAGGFLQPNFGSTLEFTVRGYPKQESWSLPTLLHI